MTDALVALAERLRAEWPASDDAASELPLLSHWAYAVLPPLAYLVSIGVLRRAMATREAFSVPKWFQAAHNGFLVVLSAYMAFTLIVEAIRSNFGLVCNAVVPGPAGVPMMNVVWIFTISKIYEFVDTWIMILRKKDSQVTFLHVYHHASIYFVWWVNLKHSPGGEAYQSAAANSLVHVVMYSYYFLRTVHPSGNYWWKRYITQMQIIQFVLFVAQGLFDLYYECLPMPLALFNEVYAWTLLALFVNFFIRSYLAPRKRLNTSSKPKRS